MTRPVWAAAGLVWLCGCSSAPAPVGPPGDALLEQTLRAGDTAALNGQHDAAARLYTRALDRALARDDADAVFLAATQAAAMRARVREFEAAAAALDLAAGALPGDDDERWLDLAAARARLALRQERWDDALAALDARAGLAARAADGRRRFAWHAARAETLAALGRWGEIAEPLAAMESEWMGEGRDASLWRARGLLARGQGRHADAADAFEREAAALRERLDYQTMAMALSRAATSREAAGDVAGASSLWRRAGLSMRAQGDEEGAADALSRAASLNR